MELIKITQHNTLGACVSARLLYDFLEVKAQFTDWCKRMFEYGFEQGQDYADLVFHKNVKNPLGGRHQSDYAFTLDMAKEIAMLQRSEKGRQIRRYFINCEKRLQEFAQIDHSNELVRQLAHSDHINAHLNKQLEESTKREKELKASIEKMVFKSRFFDDFMAEAKECYTTSFIASEFALSGKHLNKLLIEMGIQKKMGKHFVLTAEYTGYNFARNRYYTITDEWGKSTTSTQMVWTAKGRALIHSLIDIN